MFIMDISLNEQKLSASKIYSTFDIFLASCLLYLNFKLLELRRDNPKKVLFCFLHEDRIEQAVDDYFNCNLQVDCLTFTNQLKNLKNRIYTG